MEAKRYVVVGGGAAGLSCLYTLQKYTKEENTEIHLIETSKRIGGHANSVMSHDEEENKELVDVGFMVFNKETYPNLIRIFSELNIPTEESDMSLSVFDSNLEWSFQSSYKWMLQMMLNKRFWKFVVSHNNFSSKARKYLNDSETYKNHTVGEFCEGLDQDFCNNWLIPFVSAVWSVGEGQSKEFSAIPLLKFMDNHRFLTLGTIKWRTVSKRSVSYVDAILKYCPKVIIHNESAVQIYEDKNEIELQNGTKIQYDKLILACSAPNQYKLNPPAKEWLKNFKVSQSRIVGHTKPYGMPKNKIHWSSWNVKGVSNESNENQSQDKASVTYWLSKIQNLKNQDRFVTVNPKDDPEGIFFDEMMEHPIMDIQSYYGQLEESKYQGISNIYHAGAWLRNGFHEDAFFTGCLAARRALDNQTIPVEYPTGSKGILPAKAILGVTNHIRYKENNQKRKFSYPLYLYKWDTRFPPNNFHREDFFGDHSIPLDTQVRKEFVNQLGFWPLGKIEVFGNLRSFGFSFNPIIPFFAYDENDNLIGLLCEVHNTPWGERCLYAMKVNSKTYELEPKLHYKKMHVSPFNPPPEKNESNWNYIFQLKGKDNLSVIARKGEEKVIKATWELKKNQSEISSKENEEKISSNQENQKNNDDKQYQTHNVNSGSWRTFFWIYLQALLLLFKDKQMMYHYDSTHLNQSFWNISNVSLLWSILPGLLFLTQGSSLFTSYTIFTSMIFLLLFKMSGNANLLHFIGFFIHFSLLIQNLIIFNIFELHFKYFCLHSLILSLNLKFNSSNYNKREINKWNSLNSICFIGILLSFQQNIIFQTLFTFISCFYCLLILSSKFDEFLINLNLKMKYLYINPLYKYLCLHISSFVITTITKNQILIHYDNGNQNQNLKYDKNRPILVIYNPIEFFWGLMNGDLGVGESYVHGDWSEYNQFDSCKRDEELFKILRVFASFHDSPYLKVLDQLKFIFPSYWKKKFSFLQKFGSLDRESAAASISSHYDDGNDIFASFLDNKMVYTSAFFDDKKSLDENENLLENAQIRKIERILDLCNVNKGDKILDIGSGWGALVGHANQLGYNAKGLCNCKNMTQLARDRYGHDNFMIMDYRDLDGNEKFDAITCVEMIEAIPARDYKEFVDVCDRVLDSGSRVSMQVINALSFNNPVARRRDPLPLGTFVTTHIFPGQQLPNMEFIHEAFVNSGKFKRVYSETTGHHYAITLALWARSLMDHSEKFPPAVINKYLYYLCWCRAAFDAELLQLSRIVFQKV